MFIIAIELEILAVWKQTAGVERRGVPFPVLTLIENLSTNVGSWVVRAHRESPLQRHPIPIAPGELVLGPVKVHAVAVGKQDPPYDREPRSSGHYQRLCV